MISTTSCDKQKIQSLMINDVNVIGLTTKVDNFEIGIKCAFPVKVGVNLFTLIYDYP